MARSAYEWVSDVQRRLRDTAGSQTIWSRREIQDALVDAQREARGQFWVDAVYQSIALTSGNNLIALPPYVGRIRRVERSLTGSTHPLYMSVHGDPWQWQEIRDWQQVAEQQTNYLLLGTHYWFGQLRIRYEADLPIFPLEDTLSTSITETARIIPFANSASPMWTWPVPGYAKVEPGGDIFYYEAVTLTSFTGVQRGMFGTGPQTGTLPFGLRRSSATIVSPVWIHEHPNAEDFITRKAIASLLEQRLLDGDVEGSRTIGALAAEWGRQAEAAKRGQGQRHLPRTLQVRRQRRY